jgi:hypothetical protein
MSALLSPVLVLGGGGIMRYAICFVVAISLVLAGLQPALAERRVALVVGNSAYLHTPELPNPRNDAEAIARLLGASKFDEVLLRTDLDHRGMYEAVRQFEPSARAADVALVYYAGHGLEVGGQNYLMPVDARLARDSDLDKEAVTLAALLSAAGGARKLKLVILDACRNNPVSERMVLRAGKSRSVQRGLARIESKGDGLASVETRGEVLVAYAAKAGTVALDGRGRHSPYATALLKHLATPGLDVLRVFGRVKDAVLRATDDAQEPWIYGSPGGDSIALVPALARPALPTPAPKPKPEVACQQRLQVCYRMCDVRGGRRLQRIVRFGTERMHRWWRYETLHKEGVLLLACLLPTLNQSDLDMSSYAASRLTQRRPTAAET